MLDKIGPRTGHREALPAAARVALQSTGNVPAQPTGLASHDSAVLSEQAHVLGTALHAVRQAPDLRAERVAALRRQIEAGTYAVPAEAIAKKLLEFRA